MKRLLSLAAALLLGAASAESMAIGDNCFLFVNKMNSYVSVSNSVISGERVWRGDVPPGRALEYCPQLSTQSKSSKLIFSPGFDKQALHDWRGDELFVTLGGPQQQVFHCQVIINRGLDWSAPDCQKVNPHHR